jgi:hypothetical protein
VLLGRGEQLALVAERVALAELGGDCGDLVRQGVQLLGAPPPGVRLVLRLAQPFVGRAPGGELLREVLLLPGEPRSPVEEPGLPRLVEERLVLALTVDLGQVAADLAQLGDGHQLTVDLGAVASGGVDPARDQELGGTVGIGRVVAEHLVDAAEDGRRELEDALDAHALGAGPHHLARPAATEQQRQRLQQQALARARRAGDDVEPGGEADLGRLDQGQIPHA